MEVWDFSQRARVRVRTTNRGEREHVCSGVSIEHGVLHIRGLTPGMDPSRSYARGSWEWVDFVDPNAA